MRRLHALGRTRAARVSIDGAAAPTEDIVAVEGGGLGGSRGGEDGVACGCSCFSGALGKGGGSGHPAATCGALGPVNLAAGRVRATIVGCVLGRRLHSGSVNRCLSGRVGLPFHVVIPVCIFVAIMMRFARIVHESCEWRVEVRKDIQRVGSPFNHFNTYSSNVSMCNC